MPNPFQNFRWGEALPRMAADFAVVQLSAVLSLMVVMLVRVYGEGHMDAAAFAELMDAYYARIFVPLSLIFPLVFLVFGFYTTSRSFLPEYKRLAVFQGTSVATLIYLAISFTISRSATLPRSALVAFGFFVAAGTVGTRWLKHALAEPDAACDADTTTGPAIIQSAVPPVLVVGGAGYIGSILVRKLLDAGRRVRVLDSLVYGTGAIRDVLDHPRLELIVGDCRNIQSVVAAVKGVESIVDLAAIVGDPACEQDRNTALETNYAATRMMIEVAKGFTVRRFIFASSCSVYGASESLMDERSAVRPLSLYGQTKVNSEKALLQAKSESFHPTVLRLATVFGNSYRPRFDLVVNLLTAKACQDKVITIYNGQQWRPFIHVSDVAQGFADALNAPLAVVSGEVFNLGDSRLNYTLAQVAEKIQDAFPGTRVEHVENADRRNYRVCFDKIRNLVGFQAQLTVEDGIEELRRALACGAIPDYTDPLYHNQKFLQKAGSPANMSEVDTYVMAAFSGALASFSQAARPVPAA